MRAVVSHGGHVESAEEYTLRLRYPGDSVEENDLSGSFLYFGNIWPCAIPTSTGPLVPRFTDPIKLFPTSVSSSGSSKSFSHYAVYATLATLYIPKHPQASHASTDTKDWISVPIHLNDPNAIDPRGPGLRLILDSCSGNSYFPENVVDEIATKWLGNSLNQISGLHCKNGHIFDQCDLVFRFVGMGGKEVDYRCTAGHFLSSPWPCVGGVRSPIRATDGEKPPCILGMNFFWTAFVRHVNRSKDPYVQFAPQRFIDAVGQRFEQPRLQLHDGLSPRLEAIRWGRRL
ncbi:hypothetical protein C8T65DRAFT_635234 [Cerioporus squamosus]|nr:hypothetical protein C8T65DRAFT_635234 [Cerioporus squamosus]